MSSCEQCKILNRYKKDLKSLQNLHMVNSLCEEKSVVEVTGGKRSAIKLLRALRIAVHNHFLKLGSVCRDTKKIRKFGFV